MELKSNTLYVRLKGFRSRPQIIVVLQKIVLGSGYAAAHYDCCLCICACICICSCICIETESSTKVDNFTVCRTQSNQLPMYLDDKFDRIQNPWDFVFISDNCSC